MIYGRISKINKLKIKVILKKVMEKFKSDTLNFGKKRSIYMEAIVRQFLLTCAAKNG